MQIQIYDTPAQACRAGAFLIAAQVTENASSVLGLATGSTPIPCYEELISFYKQGLVDFSKMTTFNLDEYCGLALTHPQSYHSFMDEQFFNHINVNRDNINLPSGDTHADGARYDALIAAHGGIDMQLLGIGGNGHIGFNEPSDAFTYGTHVVGLAENTISDNARFFESIDDVPRKAISMGVGSIMEARKIVLIATGASKAKAIRETVLGEITPNVPATILRMHKNCVILADKAAASLL